MRCPRSSILQLGLLVYEGARWSGAPKEQGSGKLLLDQTVSVSVKLMNPGRPKSIVSKHWRWTQLIQVIPLKEPCRSSSDSYSRIF